MKPNCAQHRSLLLSMLVLVGGCTSIPHADCTVDELKPWRLSYAAMLRKQIRYPPGAVEKNQSGTVEIRISVSKAVPFPDVVLLKSSGFQNLDNEAVRVAKATRLEAPICGGVKSDAAIAMPVVFSLVSD